MHRLIGALAGALALLAASDQVVAQSWPARPIKFIVSQAAGGTPDIICRLIAEKLSRALGQPVVVDNKPGGGNIIGAQTAARSAPDGYTFFFATAAALVTNPYTFKSLPYDPARNFVPVSMVASNPFFLLANPGVPARTLQELVQYANPSLRGIMSSLQTAMLGVNHGDAKLAQLQKAAAPANDGPS